MVYSCSVLSIANIYFYNSYSNYLNGKIINHTDIIDALFIQVIYYNYKQINHGENVLYLTKSKVIFEGIL